MILLDLLVAIDAYRKVVFCGDAFECDWEGFSLLVCLGIWSSFSCGRCKLSVDTVKNVI